MEPSKAMDTLRSFLGKYFYFCLSLLIAVVVVYGFSHTVNDNLIHAHPIRPIILWFHAIAFCGWVVFFIVQSALVRTHNVSIHRKLGWFGLALGIAMIVLGYTTAVTMAKYRVINPGPFGDPAPFLIVPFHDITSFAIFFTLAIWYRKKPELHRRFIFIASCVLTAAAFGRFPTPLAENWWNVGVDSLVFLGMVRDLIVMKRVHRIYCWALPCMIVVQVIQVHIVNHPCAAWLGIAHWLMR